MRLCEGARNWWGVVGLRELLRHAIQNKTGSLNTRLTGCSWQVTKMHSRGNWETEESDLGWLVPGIFVVYTSMVKMVKDWQILPNVNTYLAEMTQEVTKLTPTNLHAQRLDDVISFSFLDDVLSVLLSTEITKYVHAESRHHLIWL